ncbi:MAG: hypothetical protein J6C07_02625 [Lachnospiraceae bacterium]|nr:hypothetical protein [Lachnospiraceae bacterium]
MKQKYYLRGLGFGILITALVFIFAAPSKMSDEEIIKRAEELGYSKASEQESNSIGLKDLLENETPAPTKAPELTVTDTPIPEPSDTPVPTKKATPTPTTPPEPTAEPILTATPTPEPTPTPTTEPTATPTPEPTPTKKPESAVKTATIVVERGNTATVVCEKIEKAGIVKDGEKLKDYLIKNNLADYINVGTFQLSSDMSLKEISKILTGR